MRNVSNIIFKCRLCYTHKKALIYCEPRKMILISLIVLVVRNRIFFTTVNFPCTPHEFLHLIGICGNFFQTNQMLKYKFQLLLPEVLPALLFVCHQDSLFCMYMPGPSRRRTILLEQQPVA